MTFEVFQRRTLRGLRWFWRLRAANGRIVADSAEGYHNRDDALDGVEKVQATGPQTRVKLFPAIGRAKAVRA